MYDDVFRDIVQEWAQLSACIGRQVAVHGLGHAGRAPNGARTCYSLKYYSVISDTLALSLITINIYIFIYIYHNISLLRRKKRIQMLKQVIKLTLEGALYLH